MNVLCQINDFKKAINEIIELLDCEKLNLERGVEFTDEIKEIKSFFVFLKNISKKANSYEELIKILNESKEIDKRFLGFLGKILDIIQVLKEGSERNRKIRSEIIKNLEETGHWRESMRIRIERYHKELIEAIVIYNILEIAYFIGEKKESRLGKPLQKKFEEYEDCLIFIPHVKENVKQINEKDEIIIPQEVLKTKIKFEDFENLPADDLIKLVGEEI